MIKVIKSGSTNCYIINCGARKILIDAGTKADKGFIRRLQKQTPIDDIDLVILTHGHYDHVGYASQLQNEYGRKVAIHKGDLEKVSCGKMNFPYGKGLLSNFIRTATLSRMRTAQYSPFIPDIIIENETIDIVQLNLTQSPRSNVK